MTILHGLKQIYSEHYAFRRQLPTLARTDLIKTYRGAALGWAWAIIKPTITIFVYWFAFSIGLRVGKDVGEYPFFLWLLAGIVPWFYISEMLTKGSECVRKYKFLVTKMSFPVSTIPTFVSLSKLFANMTLVVIAMLIFVAFGKYPDWYWLQLPYYILCQFAFGTLLTQVTAILSVLSKDFMNLMKSLVTATFWLSGILWSPDSIDIPWLRVILSINPVTYIASGYRKCFVDKELVITGSDGFETIAFFSVLLLLQLISGWLYGKLRRELPDVL